jgi:DNA-binding XRE family transcriptional regulator
MTLTTAPRRKSHRRPNRVLQSLRINEGLSPNDLAYRAGISGNTVRLAEAGFRPTPRVQFAIARVFEQLPLDIWPLEDQR